MRLHEGASLRHKSKLTINVEMDVDVGITKVVGMPADAMYLIGVP